MFDKDASDAQIQERAQQIFGRVYMRLKAAGEGAGISKGIVTAQPEMTFNQLYEVSDKALYRAKETGRGRRPFSESKTTPGIRKKGRQRGASQAAASAFRHWLFFSDVSST